MDIYHELIELFNKMTQNKCNKLSLLINKYQELSELYENMTQERINKRPQSCQHILDDRQKYFLNTSQVEKELKEFYENCDQLYKNSYIFSLINNFTLKYNGCCDECNHYAMIPSN